VNASQPGSAEPAQGAAPPAGLRGVVARVLPRGALLLSALTFLGYLVGLFRDRTFARTFGTGPDLDTYNAALVLPELALDVLVVAGLTAAFVPVFTEIRKGDPDAAEAFARTVLTGAIALMAVVVGILFVVAPQSVDIVAPGFTAPEREQYTQLFRIMCVTSLIFAASFALGEMLVARQRFLSYGLAPVLYNGGIVGGAILLSPAIGVYGAAIGTVVGALAHLAVRVLEVRRLGMRYRPQLGLRSAAFREYAWLSLPKTLSQPIEPLTFLFFTAVASTLAAGSVSSVSFARNFQSVPVSLIGIAFSVAAFPAMSTAAAAGDRARYLRLVITNLCTITLFTSAAAVVLYLLAPRVVNLFLGGEAFSDQDAATTGLILAAFTPSIPLESMTHLLARAVYATRNTLLPVGASVAGLAVTVVTVELLVGRQGVVALPLGFVSGQAAKVVVLLGALLIRSRTVRARVNRDADSAGPPGVRAPRSEGEASARSG
jgi:putative peptidoglycan lipid II flippase